MLPASHGVLAGLQFGSTVNSLVLVREIPAGYAVAVHTLKVHSVPATGCSISDMHWLAAVLLHSADTTHSHISVNVAYVLCRQMCQNESSRVDFAMAEALAFGTLALRRGVRPAGVTPSDYFSTDPSLGLNRGHYAVRLSGQDSERGTFNQRHAAVYDQTTGERYV